MKGLKKAGGGGGSVVETVKKRLYWYIVYYLIFGIFLQKLGLKPPAPRCLSDSNCKEEKR